MRTTLTSLLAAGALLACATPLRAQDEPDTDVERPASHFAINLTVGGTGLSIGNSARVNGIRINWSDRDLERVNGLNLTIWKPYRDLSGVVNGIAIGVVGPGASEINGLAFGLGGVVAERRMSGIALAGLGTVSNGDIRGIAVAGLGTVANRDLVGIGLAGLGTVANGSIRGFSFAGLGAVANHDISGIAIAGLGAVANHDIRGFALSGLGSVANGDVDGFLLSGVGSVANGSLRGVAIGGVAAVVNGDARWVMLSGVASVVNGDFRGLMFGGVAVVSGGSLKGVTLTVGEARARAVSGFSVAGYLRTRDFTGLGLGVYNRVRGQQTGITIGLVNYARRLNGFQFGLINIAGNNRGIAKVLPIMNAHL